jgi:hypothetical protein
LAAKPQRPKKRILCRLRRPEYWLTTIAFPANVPVSTSQLVSKNSAPLSVGRPRASHRAFVYACERWPPTPLDFINGGHLQHFSDVIDASLDLPINHSPRPLIRVARKLTPTSGATRRENADSCPSSSLRGALATKQSILPLCGTMDCFASLAMTVSPPSSPATGSALSRRPMTGSGGRSSIPPAPVMEPRSRGVLDTPHARGMTTFCG